MLVVQRVFRAKRTNLHEKYDYPSIETTAGNVEPIKVRNLSVPDGERVNRELVFGSLRLRACLELGLPVLSMVTDELDQRAAFIERAVTAAPESLIERGRLYVSALDAGLFPSRRRLAESVGAALADVVLATDLASLPVQIIDTLSDPRQLSIAAARKLTKRYVDDPQSMLSRAQTLRQAKPKRDAEAVRTLTA